MLENDESLESDRGTETQSGSSVGWNGFAGRLGFRMTVELPLGGAGGATADRAIFPLSSHHLWRSELAGGRPGSTGSYPMRSSSSESSLRRFVVGCPMSALRRS